MREVRVCSSATEVDGVSAWRGGFRVEPATAVDGQGEGANCDECEEKTNKAAPTACRKERKQAGGKKSIGDGTKGFGRFVVGVTADVVGVDGDVGSCCAVR